MVAASGIAIIINVVVLVVISILVMATGHFKTFFPFSNRALGLQLD